MTDLIKQKNTLLLVKLHEVIHALSTEIENCNEVKIYDHCFDQHTFQSEKPEKGYKPYYQEIESNYQKLKNLIQHDNEKYVTQIQFLSELILNQITALKRELATHWLNTPSKRTHYQTLFEQHAQNLEYLRRLESMKFDLINTQNQIDYERLNQTEQRIMRCKEAIDALEKKMDSSSR